MLNAITVVRLGTYTAKVPVYNSLKACKGTMFFLPLPLSHTLETLGQVKHPGDGGTILPDPELYIIVNGKPTTSKVVWRSLVNVDHVNPKPVASPAGFQETSQAPAI